VSLCKTSTDSNVRSFHCGCLSTPRQCIHEADDVITHKTFTLSNRTCLFSSHFGFSTLALV